MDESNALHKRLSNIEYEGESRVHALIEKSGVGIHARVEEVNVVIGSGFTGDHPQKDWWRGKRVEEREVTAISIEVVRALRGSAEVPGDNIVTEGIDLRTLSAGDRIEIGNVVLRRAKKNHRPCDTFARRFSEEGRTLVGELSLRGALFSVESGGFIRCGDPILLRSES